MTESSIVHLSGLSGLGLVLSSWLWSLGGRDHKWIRRLGATFVISLTIVAVSCLLHRFSLWTLGLWPSLILGSSLGYGADEVGDKLLRRSAFAVVHFFAGVYLAFVFGAWGLLPLNLLMALLTVYFALANPVYAAAEEFFVCFLLYGSLILYPFHSI